MRKAVLKAVNEFKKFPKNRDTPAVNFFFFFFLKEWDLSVVKQAHKYPGWLEQEFR